jgi:hypothetical protein
MRTIADFRRAAVLGSVWQCTNHVHPHVSGERRITGGTKALKYTGTKADGTTFSNGRQDIPRRADVRIDGDSITWLQPDGSDGYTWTLVRDAAPAEDTTTETSDTPPPTAAVDPVAVEAKRVIRHFQKLTSEQRANRAASHRLGPRQRTAVGEYFYTHPDVPGTSFESRKRAAEAAVAEPGKRRKRVEAYAAKLAAETIRDEDNPRPVDPTDDVLAKTFEHCTRPAPADMYDEIRAAYAGFVAAWEDERHEAAKARYAALMNRPDVAAVAARLATLTERERRHLDAAYRHHFRLYRTAQTELTHRCGRAYSEQVGSKYGYRDVLHVARQVAWAPPPSDPSMFDHNAAEDYVKALLWGDLLTEDERPVFTGPWLAVIGDGGPRAELCERTEAYVSPWATV